MADGTKRGGWDEGVADGTKRGELDTSVAAGTEAWRMGRGRGGRALPSCPWQPRPARPAVGCVDLNVVTVARGPCFL